ncbi:MAG: hypothetical protein IPO66_20170 [Rhodanobacteraceae bacterium]|nr:hypothetical protein [Rhodanobacteraceae bacterium]
MLRVDDAGLTLLARDPARAHGSVLALSEDRDGRIPAAADSGLYRVSGDRLQAIEVDWLRRGRGSRGC